MVRLHIQMFGSLTISCLGKSVSTFPTRYVSELLSYLLLYPQKQHAREKLIAYLWPECDTRKGRARFSTTLWRLRCVFKDLHVAPGDFLSTSRDWISWRPTRPYTSDLSDFLDQISLAHAAQTNPAREAALQKAIFVYTGDLCTGLYADWCLIERERLARTYLAALGELMEAALDRQAYQQAIELGQTILQEDPLREEIHRALIHCYGRSGQLTNAIRQFQLCTNLLQNELGILPMPDTIAAYQQVLAESAVRNLNDPLATRHHRDDIQAAFADFLRAGQQLQQKIL